MKESEALALLLSNIRPAAWSKRERNNENIMNEISLNIFFSGLMNERKSSRARET